MTDGQSDACAANGPYVKQSRPTDPQRLIAMRFALVDGRGLSRDEQRELWEMASGIKLPADLRMRTGQFRDADGDVALVFGWSVRGGDYPWFGMNSSGVPENWSDSGEAGSDVEEIRLVEFIGELEHPCF